MIEESFKKVADLAFKINIQSDDIQLPEIKPLQARKMSEISQFLIGRIRIRSQNMKIILKK